MRTLKDLQIFLDAQPRRPSNPTARLEFRMTGSKCDMEINVGSWTSRASRPDIGPCLDAIEERAASGPLDFPESEGSATIGDFLRLLNRLRIRGIPAHVEITSDKQHVRLRISVSGWFADVNGASLDACFKVMAEKGPAGVDKYFETEERAGNLPAVGTNSAIGIAETNTDSGHIGKMSQQNGQSAQVL